VLTEDTVLPQTGRGHRKKQPSSKLKDFITNTICVTKPVTSLASSKYSGTPFPIAYCANCDNFFCETHPFFGNN